MQQEWMRSAHPVPDSIARDALRVRILADSVDGIVRYGFRPVKNEQIN
jgi:hypothetical protein